MNKDREITAVIPARLASTRLPNKVLADIAGHPMIWHVWQRVRASQVIGNVYVATDAEEVFRAVESWGGQALMTSPACSSGTERIASILDHIPGDFILNIQGDEPLIDPFLLDHLASVWLETGRDMVTPIYPILDLETLENPNVVKVVRARDGRVLYFSRSPVPYVRDHPRQRWLEVQPFWGHAGVYGYRREVLTAYPRLPESPLEPVERLEQLRFLDAGYQIYAVESSYRPIAVDTAADLERVREVIQAQVQR